MNKYLFGAMALCMAVGAQADDKKAENDSTGGFKFTDVKVVKTTPVKDREQIRNMLELLGNLIP